MCSSNASRTIRQIKRNVAKPHLYGWLENLTSGQAKIRRATSYIDGARQIMNLIHRDFGAADVDEYDRLYELAIHTPAHWYDARLTNAIRLWDYVMELDESAPRMRMVTPPSRHVHFSRDASSIGPYSSSLSSRNPPDARPLDIPQATSHGFGPPANPNYPYITDPTSGFGADYHLNNTPSWLPQWPPSHSSKIPWYVPSLVGVNMGWCVTYVPVHSALPNYW